MVARRRFACRELSIVVGAVWIGMMMASPVEAQSGLALNLTVDNRSTTGWRLPFADSVDLSKLCTAPGCGDAILVLETNPMWRRYESPFEQSASSDDKPSQGIKDQLPRLRLRDRNRSIFYKNKLEFGLDVGWLPINIPFVFDFLLGDGYNFSGLYYTLVPVIASVRWHLDDAKGPIILRGNWDLSFSLSATAIPRGPETHYFSYIMGIRRNFVPRRWKATPYWDGRIGLGLIDAKGPLGVEYAQGQNFTFTLNLGSGVRYNLSPWYAISAGMNYMHISNLYLSQPRFLNFGINVYGPMVGIDVQLGRHRKQAAASSTN